MKKMIVTYFSASGTTKSVAVELAKAVGADISEIKAVLPYSQADLDWNDKNSRCYREWKDKDSRPSFQLDVPSIDGYEYVFVGYPIWWEKAPSIIYSFLERYDFSGKTIIPFSTSGGSIRGSIGHHLHKYCSENTNWKKGKLLNGRITPESLVKWVNGLGLEV